VARGVITAEVPAHDRPPAWEEGEGSMDASYFLCLLRHALSRWSAEKGVTYLA
jgi:hypothetical protein